MIWNKMGERQLIDWSLTDTCPTEECIKERMTEMKSPYAPQNDLVDKCKTSKHKKKKKIRQIGW